MLRKLVDEIGVEVACEVLKQTEQIQRDGGQIVTLEIAKPQHLRGQIRKDLELAGEAPSNSHEAKEVDSSDDEEAGAGAEGPGRMQMPGEEETTGMTTTSSETTEPQAAQGAQRTRTRKRAPGGVFIKLTSERMPKDTFKQIMAEEKKWEKINRAEQQQDLRGGQPKRKKVKKDVDINLDAL